MSDLLPLLELAFHEKITPANDLGQRGAVEWLALDWLFIDPRYQRPVMKRGQSNIRRIVQDFNWSLFSPLVVARRAAKTYAIIDGQHRAIAAKSHGGIDSLPCLIIAGTGKMEARAFAIINGQVTGVTEAQIHVARVLAGEPDALELDHVCQAAQVRVLRAPCGPYKHGDTLAIGMLRLCQKRYGSDVLISALQCITQTDDGNPGFVRAPIIQGFCEALSSRAAWCDAGEALFRAVEKIGVPKLYANAERMRARDGGKLSTAIAGRMSALLTSELGARAA